MRVFFQDFGGIQTRFYRAGSGEPVVLLHGAGVSSDTWCRNIGPLSQYFSVYAPDTLGHGFTGSGDYRSGPPFAPAIEHLVSFVDGLGLERFSVVGSSYGALLAALLYFRLPGRVSRLIFNSSGSLVNSDDGHKKGVQAAYDNGLSAIENPTQENCRRRMQRIFFDPAAVPEEVILMQMTLYSMPGAREAFERRLRGLMDVEACRPFYVFDRLHEIAVPTLMVWGREDPRSDYERALEAARRMPDARMVTLERCKHHPHMEYPERFNELARGFFMGEMDSVAA